MGDRDSYSDQQRRSDSDELHLVCDLTIALSWKVPVLTARFFPTPVVCDSAVARSWELPVPGESDQSSAIRHPAAVRFYKRVARPAAAVPSSFRLPPSALVFRVGPLRPPPPPALLSVSISAEDPSTGRCWVAGCCKRFIGV